MTALPPLTVEERANLTKLAEKATPGPWEAPLKDLGEVPSFRELDFYFSESYEAYPPLGHSGPVFVASGKENAAYIAAANPSVLLRLLAEIEQLAGELRSVDAVLARRPALADCESRWQKVERACSTAGRAVDSVTRLELERDAALAQVREAERRWEALQAKVAELKDRAESLENGHDVPLDDVQAEMARLESAPHPATREERE